jgi:hypothetical protein
VDVDRGRLLGGRLKDVAVVVDLDELAPVGGWATSGRHRWWFQRFAEMCENLADGPWLWWNAISRMSPPQLGHSSGNSSPARAMSFAQAIREVSCEPGF